MWIAPSSVIIIGRSVGGGPSVWLASQTKPAALLLLSPFKSTFTTAFDLPFPLFPRDRFPNLKRIRSLDIPLLVIHGEEDEPFGSGASSQHFPGISPASPTAFFGFPDTSTEVGLVADEERRRGGGSAERIISQEVRFFVRFLE